MKTKLKINISTILVLVASVVFFFWLNHRKNEQIIQGVTALENQEQIFETYKSEMDGIVVAQQKEIEVAEEAYKEFIKKDSIQRELIEHYKKLSQVVKYEYVYKTDTVTLEVPIYVEKDTSVTLEDECFKASLSLSTGLLSLDGFSFENRQDIVIGTQRGLLGRTESHISIRNTNPCIQVTGMESYNIVYEKKWWENPLIIGGISATVGFVGGMIVNK